MQMTPSLNNFTFFPIILRYYPSRKIIKIPYIQIKYKINYYKNAIYIIICNMTYDDGDGVVFSINLHHFSARSFFQFYMTILFSATAMVIGMYQT